MADFYLDHGAYATALGAAPTWGVPQDGDGSGMSAATAAAVAEIKINAVPTASETITIAGAVITAGASAAANVFVRGAAPSNTATNIVTLINSSNFTNTVGTSVAHNTGIGPTANQGRNMFFARVKSGADDTVQIMFRIGSGALNHANNSNVAISTSGWGTAPTITQFAGGSGGCFGWLINPAALGQGSSITINQYGLLLARPTVVSAASSSSTFAISETDTVWMRSGAGQTIATTMAVSVSRVASSNNLNLVLDSNTKWTGDSGTGVVSLDITQNASGTAFSFGTGTFFLGALAAEKFKIRRVGAAANSLSITSASAVIRWRNLFLEDTSSASGTLIPLRFLQNTNNHSVTARIENCVFNFPNASATARQLCTDVGAPSGARDVILINCEVRQNYTGVVNPTGGLLALVGGGPSNKIEWFGGKITGLGSYRQPVFSGASALVPLMLRAEDVLGADIPATGLANWEAFTNGAYEENRRCFYSTASSGRSWRWETNAGMADWLSNAATAFPLLNGRMLDNTQWSMRATWLFGTGQHLVRGFTVPAMRQVSRGTTGSKTFLLEMLIPTAITPTAENIRFAVRYYDNSGNPVTEVKSGANLASSSASWTNAGNYPNHTARKLEFTTAAQVAQYSDVIVTSTLYDSSPTGANAEVYFDPGFTLS